MAGVVVVGGSDGSSNAAGSSQPPPSNKEGGSVSDAGGAAAPSPPPPKWAKAKARCIKWYLPVGLLVLLLFAIAWPAPGRAAAKTPINTICIVGIFFISGVKLKTNEVANALRAWPAMVVGFVTILLFTPCLSFLVISLPLATKEFAVGLAFFMVMPTTISTGYIVTGEANGNQPLALMLSAGTNLMGAVSVPLWASAALGAGGVAMDPIPMLLKLILTLLVPLVIGQLARRFIGPVREWVGKHGKFLKLVSTTLLIVIPWNKVSVARDNLLDVDAVSLLLMFVLGLATHVVLLAFNAALVAVPWFRIKVPERKSIIFMGSQKTAGIGLAAVVFLPPEAGVQGLIVLPILVAHLVQTVMDAVISVRLANWRDSDYESDRNKGCDAFEAAGVDGSVAGAGVGLQLASSAGAAGAASAGFAPKARLLSNSDASEHDPALLSMASPDVGEAMAPAVAAEGIDVVVAAVGEEAQGMEEHANAEVAETAAAAAAAVAADDTAANVDDEEGAFVVVEAEDAAVPRDAEEEEEGEEEGEPADGRDEAAEQDAGAEGNAQPDEGNDDFVMVNPDAEAEAAADAAAEAEAEAEAAATDTGATGDAAFFEARKAQMEAEAEAEAARVAAMDDEEREAYLKEKADAEAHEAQRKNVARKTLGAFKSQRSLGKRVGRGRRGRGGGRRGGKS